MAAQAGHAFLEAYLASSPDDQIQYRSDGVGTKVTLQGSLDQLQNIEYRCMRSNVPCVLIWDSGHVLPPHFDGSPIITAMGVGLHPLAPKILSSLKLLGD